MNFRGLPGFADEIYKVNYDMMLTMKKPIEAKNGTTLNEARTIEQKGFKFSDMMSGAKSR